MDGWRGGWWRWITDDGQIMFGWMMDRWIDDGRVDGWMDMWTDRRMDGYTA